MTIIKSQRRQEWGFDGVIMTDWFASGEGLAGNGKTIHAGVDLLMPGGGKTLKALKGDLKKGLVTQKDINCACKRIISALVQSRIQKEYFGQNQ